MMATTEDTWHESGVETLVATDGLAGRHLGGECRGTGLIGLAT